MASALVAWISCLLLASTSKVSLAQISDTCVRCLCEAVAGGPQCVYGATCHDGVCGPYSITLPYWQDSGRPTVGLEDRQSNAAYEKCTRDKACAETTIRGYMDKFKQDCNGDGVVDCEDYAAIHFHGGYSCNQPLGVPAQNALRNCLQLAGTTTTTQQLPTPDPEDNNDNDLTYPNDKSSYPQIDIRLGE